MLLNSEEIVKNYEFRVEGVTDIVRGKITKNVLNDDNYYWYLNYYSGSANAIGAYVPSQNQSSTQEGAVRDLIHHAESLGSENGLWIENY